MFSMLIFDIFIFGINCWVLVVDLVLESVIYWWVIEDDIFVIYVNIQGCILWFDFDVLVSQYYDDVYMVLISCEEIDCCVEDILWGIQFGFGFEELGVLYGGQVIVFNLFDDWVWDWNFYVQ